MTERVQQFADGPSPLRIPERCRLISAHKNIQHEARYAELLQDRFKVSVIGM